MRRDCRNEGVGPLVLLATEQQRPFPHEIGCKTMLGPESK